MRRAVGVLLVVVMLAACGGGGSSLASDQTDALPAAFLKDPSKPSGFTSADARCLAVQYVAIYGDELARDDLTPQELRDPKTLERLPPATTTQRSQLAASSPTTRPARSSRCSTTASI